MISISNVSKNYGSKAALKDVSFTLEKGSVFALLGPNGAGKTTLVKSILNLVRLDRGDIQLNDLPCTTELARKGVGFLPEKFNFFPFYTVEGVLQFYGQMRGLKGEDLKSQIDNALEAIHINDIRKQKLRSLSKGQMQRTGIASLLMGDVDLMILDEPFSGLDPIGIKDLKDLLLKLKDSGKTIFINSHILSEIELFCDTMAILNHGELLEFGKIKDVLGGKSLEEFFYEKVKQS